MFGSTDYPWPAQPLLMILVFAAAVIVFHVVLIYVVKLDKIGWKRADYFWLGATVLSLWGLASDLRHQVAAGDLPAQVARRDTAYQAILDQVGVMASPSLCAHFIRSGYSPRDLDEIEKQNDALCSFAGALVRSLPKSTPDSLPHSLVAGRPRLTAPSLLTWYYELNFAIQLFEAADQRYRETREASTRTDAEWLLILISPVLLALGLALRITKVTGEVILERAATLSADRGPVSVQEENAAPRPPSDEETADPVGDGETR